jgi:hypothetical protein
MGQCKTEVTAVSWWCQGNTFSHNLRVLPIGGYDGVLGMDWLELHNPMVCDWVGKKLAFEEAQKCVTLQGMLPEDPIAMSAISAEQLLKWEKGNDIWAVALLHAVDQEPPTQHASTIVRVEALLQKYAGVF